MTEIELLEEMRKLVEEIVKMNPEEHEKTIERIIEGGRKV